MSDARTVFFSVVNDSLIADPPEVVVTQSQTLITFQLQIQGLTFDPTNPIRLEPTIPPNHTFLGPWRVLSNTATLLDFYNQFGIFKYTAWVVRAGPGPIPPVPFPLVFQQGLTIKNAMP